MKKKTTAVLTAVSLSALMAVGGTMAWFSDAGIKVNTVTLGNLELAISEPEWDKSDKVVIPGDIVNKDPHIQNVNDVAAYTGIIIRPHEILSERDILRYHVPGGAEDEFLNTMELGKYWSTTGKTTTVDGKEYDIVALPLIAVDAMGYLKENKDEMGLSDEDIKNAIDSFVSYAKTEESWDTEWKALSDGWGSDFIHEAVNTGGYYNDLDQLAIFVALDSQDNPDNEIVIFDQIKFDAENMTNDLYRRGLPNVEAHVAEYSGYVADYEEPQKTGIAIMFLATQLKHNEADTAFEGLLNVIGNDGVQRDLNDAITNAEGAIPKEDHWTY